MVTASPGWGEPVWGETWCGEGWGCIRGDGLECGGWDWGGRTHLATEGRGHLLAGEVRGLWLS